MIKVNNSSIHDFQNIFLFCGSEESLDNFFLFQESFALFGKEILAPNLIEYQIGDEELLSFNSNIISEILSKMNRDDKKFINFVDIRVGNQSDSDINIYFDENLIEKSSIFSIQSALSDFTKFNVKCIENLKWPIVVKNLEKTDARYFQVVFSNKFITMRSTNMSEHLKKSFDPSRYVDSQVACFMLMTMTSGSSRK